MLPIISCAYDKNRLSLQKSVFILARYNNQILTELKNLKNRNILEIHFDKENSDSVLFAEKSENLYRVIQLNYITKQFLNNIIMTLHSLHK